jgi:23S rRNA maturation mini-RNase III
MSDGHLLQCGHKCPVDERERDAIWSRIEDLKLMVTTLDKSQAVQQNEVARVSARVEAVHLELVDKIDSIHAKLDRVINRVTDDSNELRRREGADATNRKWAKGIITVLGLLLAGGFYIGFQPAVAAPLVKDPAPSRIQTVERIIE